MRNKNGVRRPIATASWRRLKPQGDSSSELLIEIGVPLTGDPGEFLCQVMVHGLHTAPSPIWSVNPFHALCQTYQYLQFILRDEFKQGNFFAQVKNIDQIPDVLSSRTCLDTLRTMPTELELQAASHKLAVTKQSPNKISTFSALAADLCLVISKRTEEKKIDLIIDRPVKLESGWVSKLYLCASDEIEYAYTADDSLTALCLALRGACYQILEFKRLGYEIKWEDEYGKQSPLEIDVYFHENKTVIDVGPV